MTSPAAARAYEAQHLMQWEGRPLAVHNPHDKPVAELPIIYGFNNGGSFGFMHACLVAEDGTGLGSHLCSSEGYMPHDLGCVEGARADRHATFQEHYPDGYRMAFVGYNQFDGCEGLKAALAKNAEQAAKAEASPS